MSDLKLEVGKEYECGNKMRVKILHISEEPINYPVISVVTYGNNDIETGESLVHTITGAYIPEGVNGIDIVREYKEPKYVWLNVYPSSCWTYSSREAADRGFREERIGRIKLDLNELQGRWDD